MIAFLHIGFTLRGGPFSVCLVQVDRPSAATDKVKSVLFLFLVQVFLTLSNAYCQSKVSPSTSASVSNVDGRQKPFRRVYFQALLHHVPEPSRNVGQEGAAIGEAAGGYVRLEAARSTFGGVPYRANCARKCSFPLHRR